jgi:hypothetical protein
MKRILLNSDAAAGGDVGQPATPASQPTPPKAAETVAAGKSEREILLERENARLKAAVTKTAAGKRQAEEAAAIATRKAQLEQQQQQAAKQKSTWFFN